MLASLIKKSKRIKFIPLFFVLIIPLSIIPATFLRSVLEFKSLNLRLPPEVRRMVNGDQKIDYYFKVKLNEMAKLFNYNKNSEAIVTQNTFDNNEIHLDVPARKLDALSENLPISGEDYKKIRIIHDGAVQKAKLRYRGNSGWHWLVDKKSLKLKLPKGKFYKGERILNLSVKYPYLQTLAADIGADFGLLSPTGAPVRIFMNNQFYGIERYIQELDESFLRDKLRMPGDIYKGEGVAATNEYRYGFEGGTLFDNPYVWSKAAEDNTVEEGFNEDLVELSKAVRAPGIEGLKKLKGFWDPEYAKKYFGFKYFLNELHSVDGNNIKLYMDPVTGKFYQIVWDPYLKSNSRLFSVQDKWVQPVLSTSDYKLGSDPTFMQEVFSELYSKLNNLRSINYRIQELEANARMNAKAFLVERNGDTFELEENILNDTKQLLSRNRNNILKALGISQLFWKQKDDLVLFGTDGLSGINIKKLSLKSNGPENKFYIKRDKDLSFALSYPDQELNFSRNEVKKNEFEILFDQPLRILPAYVGPNRTLTDVLPYSFFIPKDFELIGIEAVNAITGEKVDASQKNKWVHPEAIDAFHPWELEEDQKEPVITFSPPLKVIDKDLVIEKNQILKILPGVTVKIAPEVNILSYGKIIAQGTADAPILFTSTDHKNHWGNLAIQGPGASGSRFEYVNFERGSLSRLHRVRYPGMVTVHHVKDISFDHCSFSNNFIGDDAIRAAKSEIDITNSKFFNTNGDAIDYDYSTGVIFNNKFKTIGNDAIDLMTSYPLIQNNKITDSQDKGISVGEGSFPIIFNNLITRSNIGIQSKDGSDPLILNNKIVKNNIGFSGIKKNWRYGRGGDGQIYNSVIESSETFVLDKDSRVNIESSIVNGEPKNVSANKDIYLKFNLNNFTPKIGTVDIYEPLTKKNLLMSDYFEDGLELRSRGWNFVNSDKIFTEEKYLKVKFRSSKDEYLEKTLNTQIPKNTYLNLCVGANKEISVDVQLIGEKISNSTLRIGSDDKQFYLPIPEGKLSKIVLRVDNRATLRVCSAEIF